MIAPEKHLENMFFAEQRCYYFIILKPNTTFKDEFYIAKFSFTQLSHRLVKSTHL